MRYALIAGHEVMIDEEDMVKIATYGPWAMNSRKEDSAHGRFYFSHNLPEVNGKRRCIKLHRIITGAKEGEIVDHIDGNTLNCQKNNLRIVNATINAINTTMIRDDRGLAYEPKKKLWRARIQVNGKSVGLGRYKQKTDAIKAYREAESKYGYNKIREGRIYA